MRLQVRDGNLTRAVAVSIDDQEACVRDLADVLDLGGVSGLTVDGVFHGCDVLLRDVALVNGSAISSSAELASTGPGLDSPSLASGHAWVGVVGGPDTGALVRMDRDQSITIGRGDANDLTIENETVSSEHALIQVVNGQLLVEDLDSHNGTWISGRAISGRRGSTTRFSCESGRRWFERSKWIGEIALSGLPHNMPTTLVESSSIVPRECRLSMDPKRWICPIRSRSGRIPLSQSCP